jgi:hypothetical protein
VPAICEDASRPTRGPSGSFSCDDGSEPACEDGSEPTPAANGTMLACPLSAQGGSGQEAEDECPAEGECALSAAPCEAGDEEPASSCATAEAES